MGIVASGKVAEVEGPEDVCCHMDCCCKGATKRHNNGCYNCGKTCHCTTNRLAAPIIPIFFIFVTLVFSFALPTSINYFTADGRVIVSGSSRGIDEVNDVFCGACNPQLKDPGQCQSHYLYEGRDSSRTQCLFPMSKCKLNNVAVGSIFLFCILAYAFIGASCVSCCCRGKYFKRQWPTNLLLYLTFAFNILALYTIMNNTEQSPPVDRYPTIKYEKKYGSTINGKWTWNNSLTEILPYQIPNRIKKYEDDGETVRSVVEEMYEFQIYSKISCRSIHDYDKLREVCNANFDALDRTYTIRNLKSYCYEIKVHGFWVVTYVFLWLTFTILLVYSILSCFYMCCKKRENNLTEVGNERIGAQAFGNIISPDMPVAVNNFNVIPGVQPQPAINVVGQAHNAAGLSMNTMGQPAFYATGQPVSPSSTFKNAPINQPVTIGSLNHQAFATMELAPDQEEGDKHLKL